jgi:hypothetical protein
MQNEIVARTGSGEQPDRPGPFRVIQRALAAIHGRIGELSGRLESFDSSRRGWFSRLDRVEAQIRHLNKRIIDEAPVMKLRLKDTDHDS